ncbi:MAG: fasciclin domain-containing protein [Bacteroidota bacterium]
MSRLLLLALALSLIGFVGCDTEDEDPAPQAQTNLADMLTVTSALSTLEAALGAADLTDALQADGEFTLFAPDNDAFSALNRATSAPPTEGVPINGLVSTLLLPANVDTLASVLTYHVVPSRVEAADLSDGQTLNTLEGKTLTVRRVGSDFFVEGARITDTDAPATNGILHRIESVLPGAVDLVGFASLSPELSTLATALGDAGLVDDLQAAGPFTVFAPTNAAFDALDAVPEGDALASVLTYHVVSSAVYASALEDGGTVMTLQGQSLTFTFETDEETGDVSVFVNDVPILATDFAADNGIVHVIGGVLLPAE